MIARKYIDAVIVAISCLVAIFVGSHIVTFSIPELSLTAAFVLTLLWAFVAGNYWWIPLLTGATLTGVFKIGFKIYPLEVTIALALIGLAPLIMVRNKDVFQTQRKPLPLVFYLAALYITIRLLIDIVPDHGSRGTMVRIYLNAIWPFAMGWLFHHCGKLSPARWAVGLVFVFLSLRAIFAVVGYLTDLPLYIPGINFVLSFSDRDSLVSMRYVAFILLLASLILFHSSRSILIKLLLLPFFPFAGGLVVMSEGRLMTLMMFLLPVAFFCWARRWILLFLFTGICFGSIALVNFFPGEVDRLSPFAARSLSGLLLKPNVSYVEEETEGSNVWHHLLRKESYDRWTQSPGTFIFGYGVVPSPDLYDTKLFALDPQEIVETSANVAAYESAFWTIVAVLGSGGFLLYVALFFQLGIKILPYLLQKPSGTIWEGILFWACYTTLTWFVTSNYQGSFPSLELFMMIIAYDIVQDGRIPRKGIEEEETPFRFHHPVLALQAVPSIEQA
jgi:hypothetical protein